MYEKTIPVPASELELLKKQAEQINERIKALSAPTNIASMCGKKPYSLPRFEDYDCRKPVVFTWLYDTDAWKDFLDLGKRIHSRNGTFVQRGDGFWNPYYVDEIGEVKIRKVEELKQEEAQISAQMIDEMVAIYNKYMVMLHPYIMLKDKFCCMHKVPVQIPVEVDTID